MKSVFAIIIMLICLTVGSIFYAYQKEWIILLLPNQTASYEIQDRQNDIPTYTQQKIILYFWKDEQWHTEFNSVIWSSDFAMNSKRIINNWITLLEDEKIIDSDIQLVSAIINSHKEMFLSFNKDIFNMQSSTYTKLMIIHGLLKTIHHNKIPVQSIRLLIHHQIVLDDHLNFSIPWPINGYIV
jgi:hypothetical protein